VSERLLQPSVLELVLRRLLRLMMPISELVRRENLLHADRQRRREVLAKEMVRRAKRMALGLEMVMETGSRSDE
jgi:hypothetical protein